jgi:hypothetical protein
VVPWEKASAQSRREYLAEADADLTALEAAGMVVVPVVPTEAMYQAFEDEEALGLPTSPWDRADAIWNAMLAASPLPTPPIQAERV